LPIKLNPKANQKPSISSKKLMKIDTEYMTKLSLAKTATMNPRSKIHPSNP